MWRPFQLLMLLFIVASVTACASKKKAPTVPVQAAAPSRTADEARSSLPAEVSTETSPAPEDVRRFGPIYFAYDDALLSEAARKELQKASDFLLSHPEVTLLLAGHADERGTPEYNLALGDERARVCRDYLMRLGVDVARVRTVSYGEERPAVPGHAQLSWSRNRRAEFQLSE